MFLTSSSYSPNPIPPPSYQNPTKQCIQTKLSQPKFTNGTKTKGGQGAHALQHKQSNSPPITTNHPHQMPIFLTETNHRHLLVDFADWLQNGLHTRAPLPHNLHYETTTTNQNSRKPPQHGQSSKRNSHKKSHTNQTTTTSSTSYSGQTFPPNHHPKTRMPAISTDTLANACGLGCEVPFRPRNLEFFMPVPVIPS